MPAWIDTVVRACRRRPGWSVAAALLGIAALVVLPWDGAIQAHAAAWSSLPGVADLLDLIRPFGRGEVAVLIALAVAASGRRRLGAQILTALILCALLTWMLKLGIGRVRPNGNAFSFVSGDTSTAFALLPLLARSGAWSLGCTAIAAAVALSRVILSYHYPADVLGGAAIGMISSVLAAGIWPARPWRQLSDRRWWIALAGVAWGAAAIWAACSPAVGWLRLFLLVWGPALVAWAAWPYLRLRLRRGWLPPMWLVAAGLMALLLGLGAAHTLLDRDEPRNALAAREMLARDSWLVPTFNGEPRLHKPILPYWLMTAALRTGLPADLACRLPAVLAMALAVLLLGLTARRLLGDQRSTVAMLVLAGSPLVLVSGSAATTDAVLVLGIAATMWVVVRCLLDGPRWWHVLAAGLAIAWALLSKGPMALVPVATVAVVALWSWHAAGRGLVGWRTWLVLIGAVELGALLALQWFNAADSAVDGAMWRVMILKHVVDRFQAPMESHAGPFWYYLPVLVASCIAWLPAFAVAVRTSVGGPGLQPRQRLILLAWALPILIAISAAQTKLPHYLLPMLWPVAVLLAVSVAEGHDAWWRWGRRIQSGILLLAACALCLGPLVAAGLQAAGCLTSPVPLAPLAAPALAAGLAFALLLALTCGQRSRFAGGAALAMATLVIALALNAWRLEVYKPAPRIAAAIRSSVAAGVPIATCGFDEPSLYFYLGPERGPLLAMSGPGALRRWARDERPGVMVATEAVYSEAGGTALPVAVLARVPGYNYSNGKAVVLLALGRQLPDGTPVNVR